MKWTFGTVKRECVEVTAECLLTFWDDNDEISKWCSVNITSRCHDYTVHLYFSRVFFYLQLYCHFIKYKCWDKYRLPSRNEHLSEWKISHSFCLIGLVINSLMKTHVNNESVFQDNLQTLFVPTDVFLWYVAFIEQLLVQIDTGDVARRGVTGWKF